MAEFEIKAAKVNWYEKYANTPDLSVYVEPFPNYEKEDLVYTKKGSLYLAEKDGYVTFNCWTGPHNEGGYGGSEFEIILDTGKHIILKGPWSSRAGCMNVKFKQQCLDVCYVYSNEFKGGMASAITLEKAKEAIEKFLPNVYLLKQENVPNSWQTKEIVYQPVLRDGRWKPNQESDPYLIYLLTELGEYKEIKEALEEEKEELVGSFRNKPVNKIFPDAIKDISMNKCPICKKEITEFRNELSKKEYQISGLCQECQDSVFESE